MGDTDPLEILWNISFLSQIELGVQTSIAGHFFFSNILLFPAGSSIHFFSTFVVFFFDDLYIFQQDIFPAGFAKSGINLSSISLGFFFDNLYTFQFLLWKLWKNRHYICSFFLEMRIPDMILAKYENYVIVSKYCVSSLICAVNQIKLILRYLVESKSCKYVELRELILGGKYHRQQKWKKTTTKNLALGR